MDLIDSTRLQVAELAGQVLQEIDHHILIEESYELTDELYDAFELLKRAEKALGRAGDLLHD